MIKITFNTKVYEVSSSREDYDDLIYNRDEELFNLYIRLKEIVKHTSDKRKKYIIYKKMSKIRSILENIDLFS